MALFNPRGSGTARRCGPPAPGWASCPVVGDRSAGGGRGRLRPPALPALKASPASVAGSSTRSALAPPLTFTTTSSSGGSMLSPSAIPLTHVSPPPARLVASRTGASISFSSLACEPAGLFSLERPPRGARIAGEHDHAVLAAHGGKAARASGVLVHQQAAACSVPRPFEARRDLIVEGLVGGQNHHGVGTGDWRARRLGHSALVDGLHEGAVETRQVGERAAGVGERRAWASPPSPGGRIGSASSGSPRRSFTAARSITLSARASPGRRDRAPPRCRRPRRSRPARCRWRGARNAGARLALFVDLEDLAGVGVDLHHREPADRSLRAPRHREVDEPVGL